MAKQAKPIYALDIRPSAQRDLKKLRKKKVAQLKRIDEVILDLRHQPRPHGSEKLSEEEEYRFRVGGYRILYQVDDATKTVEIDRVRGRSDVYRKRR